VATLEFFCNRPTVVALTEFGLDVSSIQASMTALQQAESATGVGQVVFGLEGRGKVRTIFQLLLDMETARVYLNLETGNQLAVLAEERIHMDLKVRIGTVTNNLVSKETFLTPSISILTRNRWPVAQCTSSKRVFLRLRMPLALITCAILCMCPVVLKHLYR
jgi:hypothetical protein